MGSYPIAQLREPYSVVMYMAERLNLVSLLRIQHPENDTTWSAMDICDGVFYFIIISMRFHCIFLPFLLCMLCYYEVYTVQFIRSVLFSLHD